MWDHLRNLLHDRLQGAAWRPQVEAAQLQHAFIQEIQGTLPEHLVSSLRVRTFQRGALTIEVDHPAIAQAIRLHEKKLLPGLRKQFPRLERLVFTIRRASTES